MAVHLCTCIYNCENIFTTLRDPCTSAQQEPNGNNNIINNIHKSPGGSESYCLGFYLCY